MAVPARRRDRLEHLVRYLVRPPLALARLTESTGGQLLYQFRRPWSDGSTALLLDPLEAGSVNSPERIRALQAAGADAFTIGSAAFDGSFSPRKGLLASQLRDILAACA